MNDLIFSLTEKLALITGGGTGLGLAMAKAFVGQGAKVIITGRREQLLIDAVKSLDAGATHVVCDITQFEKIPGLVKAIESDLGPIDILVNNAGINLKKDFLDYADEDFDRIIKTNLNAVFSLSREVAKIMALRKKGCILMISSMASRYGLPKVIGYTASKSGIEGMTRAMAVELSPLGIRVNCIAPGFIRTEMSEEALSHDTGRKARWR
jgi:gluconate 5-dehydrogenase